MAKRNRRWASGPDGLHLRVENDGISKTLSECPAPKMQLGSDGLAVRDTKQVHDQNGDLVVTGVVENTSTMDKYGWVVIAELHDNGGEAIRKEILVNGLQFYGVKDRMALKRRGQEAPQQDLSALSRPPLLKAGNSTEFKIVFYDPPMRYKECSITLKNLDRDTIQKVITDTLDELRKLQKPRDES